MSIPFFVSLARETTASSSSPSSLLLSIAMLLLLNISSLCRPHQVKALDARLLMGSVSQKALLLQEELRSNRARYAKFSPP